MKLNLRQRRPEAWSEFRKALRHKWATPFLAIEWLLQWCAYFLSNWTFLHVVDYLRSFGIIVAVVFYFSESGDRLKQKHYQAWQVINTAQGKGGNGGRIDALQELNADHIPLVGVDVSGAFLQGIQLQGARLSRCNFAGADLRNSNFDSADMSDANLRGANFRESALRSVEFDDADLHYADLEGADLRGADLSRGILVRTDLSRTNLANLKWSGIRDLNGTNVFAVKNAPDGFVAYALKHGAVQIESDSQ